MVADGHLLAVRLCQQGSEEGGGVLYTSLSYKGCISPRSISPAMTHINACQAEHVRACMCVRRRVYMCVRACPDDACITHLGVRTAGLAKGLPTVVVLQKSMNMFFEHDL